MTVHPDRVREVFHAVCDAPEQDRAAHLAALCDGDEELRREVESLLAFDGVTSDGLSDDTIEGATGERATPDRIGEFRIIGILGEGGSGVVYEAAQESPKRRVALKVLRAPLLTESMRRRFEREAAVVGMLQHPGIAQVHAAVMGERAGGDPPHIAIELVRGRPLTEYAQGLSVRRRLGLFCQICDAVQYAHTVGVVHRDLFEFTGAVDIDVEEGMPFGVIVGGRNFDSDSRLQGVVGLEAAPPVPCPADFNDDGEVNTLDVLAFLNAWSAGDSGADFNDDGDVNTLDVLAFLNEWAVGC